MRGIAKQLRNGLTNWHVLDCIGFAAHWAWIWCVFWSSMFYNVNLESIQLVENLITRLINGSADGALFGLETLWLVSLTANVASIAILLLVSRKHNPLANIHVLPFMGAGLTIVGTLCLSRIALDIFVSIDSFIYIAGAVLTGIGSGIVVILWAELLANRDPRQTVGFFVIALFIAIAIFVLLSLIPIKLAQLFISILPLVSILSYSRLRRSLSHVYGEVRNVVVKARPPYRMIFIALFFGLSFGAMKGLMTPLSADWLKIRDILNIVGIMAGGAAVYVTMIICKMDFNHLTYQVALPLMAAGFLFLPLQELLAVIGTGVYQCGYQYFYIVLWAMWSILTMRGNVPSGWVVTWGMFAIQSGQLVGSLGASFATLFILDNLDKAIISAVVVFIFLLIALFVFGNQTAETGWGYVKPIEVESSMTNIYDTVMSLSHYYHLSPREKDVFVLLVKGRNRSHIASELCIGDETVKSHMKSLYRKFNVHSQQDLIDLVERESKSDH